MLNKSIYILSILVAIMISCKSSDSEVETASVISSLSCSSTKFSSSAVAGTPYSAIAKVTYMGGNGSSYNVGLAIPSKGVTGLFATLTAGKLESGTGEFTLAVNGNPSAAGVASYSFIFGGQSCTINQTVLAK